MARKVFISVLGTGFYGDCKYVDDAKGFESSKTRFIQQATLEFIMKSSEWTKDDVALILLTDKAKKDNWNESITERYNQKTQKDEPYSGLESVLKKMDLPCQIQGLSIPDGKDEKQMWEIFTTLFDALHDDDELYFDLTHSFRYLPMLVLVLGNYAKFLKKVNVAYISYGNFEARTDDRAPIVDLLPLSQLQDWTYAAGQYLDSGNVEQLCELSNNELKPILKKSEGGNVDASNLKQFVKYLNIVVEERLTCRGISIIKSDNFKKLKEFSDKLQTTTIEPLNPVIDKIKESFNDFDETENASNGFAAARWCINNGLYQQAATILYENIVTIVCKEQKLNWCIEQERSIVNIAFKVENDKIKEEKWNLGLKEDATEEEKRIKRERIKEVLKDNLFLALKNSFGKMTTLRNDFNHCGMRNNPTSSERLKIKIKECLSEVERICCSDLCNQSKD